MYPKESIKKSRGIQIRIARVVDMRCTDVGMNIRIEEIEPEAVPRYSCVTNGGAIATVCGAKCGRVATVNQI